MHADPLDHVFELLADGREDDALADLSTLIREEPWNGPLYAIRALLYVDRQRLAEARSDATQAVELTEGEHPFAHYAAAAVALAEERWDDAIGSAQQAQSQHEDYLEATLLEARANAAAGRWPEAVQLTAKVLQADPAHEEAALLSTLAIGAIRGGGLDQTAWRDLAERFPLNPVARSGAGWIRLNAGDYREARVEFEQALAMDPSLPWAREGMLLALKARSPVYLGLLRAFGWLGRFPARTRRLFLILGFFGFNYLRGVAERNPATQWVIYPLLVCYVGFLVLSWLADPLLNLTLLASTEGRRLVKDDDRTAALLIGGCLGLGTIFCIAAALTGWTDGYFVGLGVGFTSFAIAAAWHRHGKRRTLLARLAAAGFGCALLSGVLPSPWGEVALLGCVLFIAATTWISSLGGDPAPSPSA